ncbi:MAG TPA: hypothetical protein VFL79_14885 [Terriglobia bacterium]|nr:hypothetical protein [Terriglobia bacterium]
MLTRRRFLGYSALSTALLAGRPLLRSGFAQPPTGSAVAPLRLAIIGSVYHLRSNLQSIADRFLVGYPFEGDWHMPNVQVVSVYVDSLVPRFGGPMAWGWRREANRAARHTQGEPGAHAGSSAQELEPGPPHPPIAHAVRQRPGARSFAEELPENIGPNTDLSQARSEEFGFRLCSNIPEALRAGTERLAVDAVLAVAEQGDYPTNDRGQILLPCYDFFRQCVQVFQEEGRGVPYFNHKQLSFSFPEAKQMVETAERFSFPLLAGSSIPVTWRLPDVDIPFGAHVEEAVMVGLGRFDGRDFDALEAMQCMLERREGGETGVKAVQLLEGDDVWQAGREGRYSRELLSSALSRSDTPLGLTLLDGRNQDLVASGALPQLVKDPAAYCIGYADGTRATLLMLNGAIMDFNISVRVAGKGLVSTQFFLPPTPDVSNTACLAAKIEQTFTTGKTPYPVQRTLLTSGMLEACLDSRHRLNQRLETPHLAVKYQPPRESQYART